MIVSASRRTDIPAFYFDWFLHRVREGYVITRNPMNKKQVRRIELSPEGVDGIVFWTKNAAPMLPHLRDLAHFAFYVQFTITGYGLEIEPVVPDKDRKTIETFQRLSEAIGAERVIWRYDPIFISDRYTIDAHCERFFQIASKLSGMTEVCALSFMDMYRSIEKKMAIHGARCCEEQDMNAIAAAISKIASSFQIKLQTCAEAIDLDAYGIGHGRCVDASLLERIGGKRIAAKKDTNQRQTCLCAQSVDIGAYNTCANGCVYCYANHSDKRVIQNMARFDVKRASLTD